MLADDRIVYYPLVRMLAVPTILRESLRDLCDVEQIPHQQLSGEDADELAVIAGRTCYWSFANPRPGGNAAYLDRIKSEGHGSILEHAQFTFFISGVSRPLAQELTRHRAGCAYSMLSQRYVDESRARCVMPPQYLRPECEEERRAWRTACAVGLDTYSRLVDSTYSRLTAPYAGRELVTEQKTTFRKMARQAARYALPEAVETKLVFSANCRALRHILEQRGSGAADLEIRRLAVALLPLLRIHAPLIFSDYVTPEHLSGVPVILTMNPKI